ncbi:hypothetical protein E4198_12665 [Streptomyces sp. RKND-216]|uniref:hypothetical protein n=1 Tax=Streptomyces sp. RKND-216 TaxID=2562581 RepID=UPI00109DFF2F|nr:hypothetical protein [Streptomyces sp. RKND-216]THA25457.1 hypothetical protein E4198_12665 [Streptomyces sp. RKND-216]
MSAAPRAPALLHATRRRARLERALQSLVRLVEERGLLVVEGEHRRAFHAARADDARQGQYRPLRQAVRGRGGRGDAEDAPFVVHSTHSTMPTAAVAVP